MKRRSYTDGRSKLSKNFLLSGHDLLFCSIFKNVGCILGNILERVAYIPSAFKSPTANSILHVAGGGESVSKN